MGENIYLLPSDINLKIRSGTVRYNNKILVSDAKFSLGKNEEVNSAFAKPEEETTTKKDSKVVQKPTITHKNQEPTHNEEKIALVLALTSGFAIWNMF